MSENDALRAFLARCREYDIDVQEARRVLARARTDVQSGRVLELDPYKLAWRRLRCRST
ncbi:MULTISPECIES: hypothetical protein [Amycolatopsis]|uniref:Uncharacterized protein n=1 Tax=Amycolatopsis viridis TaxID=185678 RepID=A0ABX0SVH2_9PSEU|nr:MULTISPECIES: hypothetical protein [Amycolatopsis]NIH80974.1 hypothetical protein [Amycolatopsis viridis]NIH84021.1 hypothetical protein [Amycolatopsis granulosa]